MPLQSLTPEQIAQIRADLSTLGVEGSELLAVPKFSQTADAHDYIREVMLGFLRAMFRSMANQYRWDPDPNLSGVLIQYADPRSSVMKGKSPAVTVELSPFTYGPLAVNDLLGGYADGTTFHTAMRNGAVVVRCRSTTKLEADSLAHVVMGGIKYFHAELESLSGFTYIDAYTANPSSGEVQQNNPQGEFFVANVVANVHYQESWKKVPNRTIKGPIVLVKNPRGILLD